MAKILVRNSNTGLLSMRVDSGPAKGHLMYTETGVDDGEPPGDPCDLFDCSSVGAEPEQANPPAMKVTVFDADYAGGSITFAGETWTQQEVQDGEAKCACPTDYRKHGAYPGTPSFTLQRHRWTNNVGINLLLSRAWVGYPDNPTPTVSGFANLNFNGVVDSKINASQNLNLGVFDPIPGTPQIGAKSDYDLTDGFFGTVNSGGVQYTWAKTFTRWP